MFVNDRTKVYIAGPMRGKPDWNQPAFEKATLLWQEWGWLVFSPMNLVAALPWMPDTGEDSDHLHHVAQIDLACIYACDAIALLPGWQESRGATMEVAVGLFLKKEFYDALTREEIIIQPLPWTTCKPPEPPAPRIDPDERLTPEELLKKLAHLIRTC